MLYALLFLPALVAIAYVVLRPRRPAIVEEAVVVNPFDTIDSILEQLESSGLGERDVGALERLAAELEAAALQLVDVSLERVA